MALVVFVLPAEYGIDPTGAGGALGLTKLSEPGLSEEQIRGNKRVGVLTLSEQPLQRDDWADEWQITLAPHESIELKYTLDQGGTIEFEWEAMAPVEYDLHASTSTTRPAKCRRCAPTNGGSTTSCGASTSWTRRRARTPTTRS